MQCPRCGNAAPQGAAFCMHCGQAFAGGMTPVQAGGAAIAIPAKQSRTTLYASLTAALILMLLIGGLAASGALKFGAQQRTGSDLIAQGSNPSEDNLQAHGSAPTGDLEARGTSPDPQLPAVAERKVMPDDVRRWLEHLERIERRREEISTDQLSQSIQMLTALQLGDTLSGLEGMLNTEEEGGEPAKSPAQSTKVDIDAMRVGWRELENDFHSLPPPPDCVPIANDYTTVIEETRGMILDIVSQIDRAEEDRTGALNKLMGMRGKSGQRIGRPARESDDGVYEVCRKYDTRKWFSISSDFGSGMLGRMGF